jgi:PAS domain S-box-containing protein
LLRRQGIAARCTWIAALNDLPDTLADLHPELLLCLPAEHIDVAAVAALCASCAPGLPLLAVRPEITEELLAADLHAGARDTINLAQPQRAHQVIARELHTGRLQRAHDVARQAVQDSRKQLDSVLTRSNDAIIDVQEGILVEANQSWLDLVGATDASAVTGQPVMDLFHRDSHVALKGALTACLRGLWKDHALQATAHTNAGGTLPVELLLTLGERDGEPCVRIMVPTRKSGASNQGAAAPAQPGTAAPMPAISPPAADEAPASPAALLSVPTLAAADPPPARQMVSNDDRVREYDAVWVRHIQAALAENRFRLVQQPITSLTGGAPMFDLMIRMLDRSRKEILPNEFLPAAERNQLLGPIDRWVIGAAARFAAETKPGCLFVRLSRQSLMDDSLPRWLTAQLAAVKVDPKQLCLTVTEALAAVELGQVRKQAQAAKALGLRFALQHFGVGPDPLAVLGAVPMDYVKLDGRLIQGVKGDSLVQSRIETLVEAARERGIETIAEHVEDANTMAILWQLGVQHLEGFLIQAPEEVVMAERA